MRVLVVDDDKEIRDVLAIAFSVDERICEVRTVGGGREALEVCTDYAPDVVLLDYWMPEMPGDAVAERLRTVHPEARIIAFSGALEQKPAWADDFCVKGDLPVIERVLDLTVGD